MWCGGPAFFEGHAVNFVHHFDANRRMTHSHDSPPLQKQILGEIRGVKPKRPDCSNDAPCVFRRLTDPDIHIAGGAWISMEAYCETTDEQLINVVAIQQFQELAEVWRKTHHHNSFSAEPACAGDESPGVAGATRASVQGH
jgi:hypothetical protein